MRTNYLILLSVLLLAGCAHQEQPWPSSARPTPAKIRIGSVEPQKIVLDTVDCSGIGFSASDGRGNICFFDGYLCYLYTFDQSGRLLKREYGLGNGPGEVTVQMPWGLYLSEEGELTLVGSALNVETLRKDGTKDFFMINYVPNADGGADNFSTYTHSIMPDVHVQDGKLYYALISEHRAFNMVDHGVPYVQQSNRLAVIDMESHNGSVLVRGYPEVYAEAPNKMFSAHYIRFDLLPEKKMLISFEATPELYVCDMEGHPERVFGLPGRDMVQDYLTVNSFDREEIKKYRQNREEKGFYGTVKAIGKWVFRSYQKGGGAQEDGLQIYENEVLVGDVSVPKGFEVIGMRGDVVISNVRYDEETERLYCYEFSLE